MGSKLQDSSKPATGNGMKKIVIHKPGGYRQLVIEEHPDPAPGPGEVLIEVAAIGVNYADCVTRMGLYASARHYIGYPVTRNNFV